MKGIVWLEGDSGAHCVDEILKSDHSNESY